MGFGLIKALLNKLSIFFLLFLAGIFESTESAPLIQQTIVERLKAWEGAQKGALHHLEFQIAEDQLEVVEEALARALAFTKASEGRSPNLRGTALCLLCDGYLESAV